MMNPPSSAWKPATRRSPRLGLVLAAMLALAAAVPAAAQDKPVMLKLSSWVPPQHPLNPSLIAWADDIKKASGGTITATLVPVRAARQGLRPLRHGARRHRRLRLRQPRLPAGPLSGDRRRRRCRSCSPTRKGGSAAIDAWYRQYAAKEMKDVHFCFAFVHDPGTLPFAQEDHPAVRHQGHEDAPGARAPSARWSRRSAAPTCRPRRRRRATCSSAASPTRSPSPGARSSCSASTRSSSYHMDVPLYTTPFVWVMNKAKYDVDVGGAEEGDRRPLHDRMGGEGRPRPGPTSSSPGAPRSPPMPGHEIYKLTRRAARRLAPGGRAGRGRSGPRASPRLGDDPKAVLDSLKQSLVKYKAGL